MGVRNKYTSGRLVFYNGADTAIGQLLQLGLTATAALLMGGGTSASPLTKDTADKNFFGYWLKSSATSGTTRGLYQKLYLSSGAGGESVRAATQVENNTPADTCNGAHISLMFGSSAGNITGLGTAVRGTLHIPTGRAINGTIAALQAEIYGDGASGAIGGTASLIRAIVDGHADLKGSFDTNGYFMDVQGLTSGDGKCLYTGAAPDTLLGSLRMRIGSTVCYLPVYANQHA